MASLQKGGRHKLYSQSNKEKAKFTKDYYSCVAEWTNPQWVQAIV